MTKDETAIYLSNLGYSAEVIEGVLIIWVSSPMRSGVKDRLRNILRSVGYKGSWGWRMIRNAETA